MKRKLISYICLVAIFMETIPVNALSNKIGRAHV